jgi:SepF-like predicted cell division protein (DUF552 family)
MRNGEIVVTDIKKVNPEDEKLDEVHKDIRQERMK